jgi:hypothetical protein
MVAAFLGREGVEERPDALPGCLRGALGGLAQQVFEFGEGLLASRSCWTGPLQGADDPAAAGSWVQVGRVRRQEEQFGPGTTDRLADGGPLVTAKIVHDDDVAGAERGQQHLLDPGGEACAVDGLVEHARSIDPVMAQRGEEGRSAARKVMVRQWP